MPSGKDTLPVKKFLEGLKDSLDVRNTVLRLGMKEADARRIFSSLISELFPEASSLLIYVDGASRGNPGQAGSGAVVKDGDGKVIRRLKKKLGVATNNTAEYSALVMALSEAKKLGARRVSVFADSELMVRQINGAYRVKSEGLKPLYAEARGLIDGFAEFSITHIDREKNTDADRLANEAIDGV